MRAATGATLGRVRDVGMSEDVFARHRSLLFTVAYEMLGSAADAEDVVQGRGCGGPMSTTPGCATCGPI
jgi:hypothetical protein